MQGWRSSSSREISFVAILLSYVKDIYNQMHSNTFPDKSKFFLWTVYRAVCMFTIRVLLKKFTVHVWKPVINDRFIYREPLLHYSTTTCHLLDLLDWNQTTINVFLDEFTEWMTNLIANERNILLPGDFNTGGSRLSRTAVKPDSRLARIFFSKICFPFSCII